MHSFRSIWVHCVFCYTEQNESNFINNMRLQPAKGGCTCGEGEEYGKLLA